MRGATIDIRWQANPPCNQQAVWNNYRSLGLNLVRLDVKTDADGAGRAVANQIPFLDAAVDCAARARMYVMPLVSVDPGSYNLAQLTSFWSVVADRYKDRPHVFYEMTNEPVSGGGYWGAANHWTAEKLTDLRGVYDIMRAAAPATHIVLFSTANLAPNATSWRAVPQGFEAAGGQMDWANVSIGFHYYGGTYKFGDPNGFGGINQMRAWGYNMFMSECNDFIGDGPSNDPRNKQQVWGWLEEAQVSWVNLDGKAGNVNTQIIPEILPYLASIGRALPVE
ncbi:MAG: cellulase family glycosylhydrolase [Rhodospirillales bacterium]